MKAIVTDAKTSADVWPAPDFRERNTLTYGFHPTRLHLFVVASIGSIYLYTIQQNRLGAVLPLLDLVVSGLARVRRKIPKGIAVHRHG